MFKENPTGKEIHNAEKKIPTFGGLKSHSYRYLSQWKSESNPPKLMPSDVE